MEGSWAICCMVTSTCFCGDSYIIYEYLNDFLFTFRERCRRHIFRCSVIILINALIQNRGL
jgi:hypothetical protein